MSIASFETTSSVFFYAALFGLFSGSKTFPFALPRDEIPVPTQETVQKGQKKLEELFPAHFLHSEAVSLTQMHQICLLGDAWLQSLSSGIGNLELFKATVQLTSALDTSLTLKKGLVMRVWQKYCCPQALAIANLIEKVKKVPNQRMLQRNVSLTSQECQSFLSSCLEVLEILQLFVSDESEAPYRPEEESSSTWPTVFDSLCNQLHRTAADHVCSSGGVIRHTLALEVIRVIFSADLRLVQPLRLFVSSNTLFSSLKEVNEATEEAEPIRVARQRFVANLLLKDIQLAESLSIRLSVELTEAILQVGDFFLITNSLNSLFRLLRSSFPNTVTRLPLGSSTQNSSLSQNARLRLFQK